jgi:hypothetical protein
MEVVLTVSFGTLNIGQDDNSVKCADAQYDTREDGNPPRAGSCSVFSQV